MLLGSSSDLNLTAIDLDADYGSGTGPGGGDSGSGPILIDPSIYDDPNPVVSCYPPCTFVLPPMQRKYFQIRYPNRV